MAERRRIHADTPHAGRLRRLRAAVRKAGFDHIVVSDPRDVAYLTGFLGGDSWLVLGSGKPTLVSDFRYAEEVDEHKSVVKIRMRDGRMDGAVALELADRGAQRIALQGEHVTLDLEAGMKKALRPHGYKAGALGRSSGLVGALRRVKDESEVRLLRKAIRIQEAALEATLDQVEIGMREQEVAAILEYEMKARGSDTPSFETIVGAGASSSRPHYTPGAPKVRAGALLLIDWGATHKGYHGDMTRTFAIGKWPAKLREIYQIVLDAHLAAAAALGAGVHCRHTDAVARKVIVDAGYGEEFGHGLGHGIGYNVHEAPAMGPKSPKGARLEAGNVVTIEPGIYLPGVGGVRIEDDYLVTRRGSTNLCSLPKDILWATRR